MTLDLPALRLLAWQGPFDPCTTCAQTAGHRCRTTSGALTTPHAPRIAAAKGYGARQPEVDALNALVASLRAANDQLTATLATSDDKLATLTAQWKSKNDDLIAANLRITQLGLDLADAQKALADYKASHPDVPVPPVDPPPPTPSRTIFGACILDKGAAGVVAKFGAGAFVRQFLGSSLTVPTFPAGVMAQVSAKPSATVTDTQIDAWLRGLAGHYVTFWHESDNDGLSAADRTARIALMNRLYDRNVALGQPCTVVPTFTGGLFASYGNDTTRDLWMANLKGDLLGIDFDGIHDDAKTKPADLIYRKGGKVITYRDEVDNGLRYIAKYAANGWQGIVGPEWGISRAAWDTDGTGRAKWITTEGAYFVEKNLAAVAWYDFQDTKTKISDIVSDGSPELTALRSL